MSSKQNWSKVQYFYHIHKREREKRLPPLQWHGNNKRHGRATADMPFRKQFVRRKQSLQVLSFYLTCKSKLLISDTKAEVCPSQHVLLACTSLWESVVKFWEPVVKLCQSEISHGGVVFILQKSEKKRKSAPLLPKEPVVKHVPAHHCMSRNSSRGSGGDHSEYVKWKAGLSQKSEEHQRLRRAIEREGEEVSEAEETPGNRGDAKPKGRTRVSISTLPNASGRLY